MSTETVAEAPSGLREKIKQRWPQIDDADLDAAKGDLDRIAELIAAAGEHSRAVVRRQLDELSGSKGGSTEESAARLAAALERLEARADELSGRISKELVPKAEEKVKENLLTSLLIALGLGFLLGLLVGGSVGRGR